MSSLEDFATQVGTDIKALQANDKDTGWRKVTSTNLENSYLLVRRIGTMCYIAIGGGRWDTFTIATAVRGQVKINLTQLPVGFRSKMAIGGAVTKDGNTIIGQIMLTSTGDGSWVQLKNVPATEFEILRCYLLSYPSHDPFPTVPLGVEI